MTVIVDTTPLHSGHKTRGIGRYTRNLVESISKTKSPLRIIMTSKVHAVESADLVHYPYFDLFHSHLPLIPPAPREIVTIHDLIPLRFKDSYRLGIRTGINLWLQLLLIRRVAAIITDSQHSKKDIAEFLHIHRNVFVIPLGVSEEFRVLPKDELLHVRHRYNLPQKYLLYVGDVNSSKNILILLRALAMIPSIPLVLVSSSLQQVEIPEVKAIHEAIRTYGLSDRVIELSQIPLDPPHDLAGIYGGATAYVHPSLYEGFGLPVLEAFACGTPVISSNAASLSELAGDAAVLVSPTVENLAESIRRVLSNQALRQELIHKGLRRARAFSWKNTATKTLSVYQRVIESKLS